MYRVETHPVLGDAPQKRDITIYVDGAPIAAKEGEMIAAALLAAGISTFRYTKHKDRPRGIYCGIGRCTDCIMTVDGIPNVRTCITPVQDGMRVETQKGSGSWTGGEGQ